AGIEAIPFGLLTFVVGALIVANAWAVIDAKIAVSAAAREATRAYAEAPADADPLGLADAAAREAIQGAGRDPGQLVLTPAAANDAATEALSDRSFYQGDRIELSSSAVEAVAVDRVFQLVDQRRHHNLAVRADAIPPAGPGCAWTVRVVATSRVEELFGKAL